MVLWNLMPFGFLDGSQVSENLLFLVSEYKGKPHRKMVHIKKENRKGV
jgi:hypothetical protein